MVDQAQMHVAIDAVSGYVAREFHGASVMHDRDFDRSAHTWIIREADGPVLLLTVSFEFLSDTLPAEIGNRLSQWHVADTLRGAEASRREIGRASCRERVYVLV